MIHLLFFLILFQHSYSLKVEIKIFEDNEVLDLEWKYSLADTKLELTPQITEEIKAKLNKKFHFEKELGKGNYGSVFKSKFLQTGETVAIKISSSITDGGTRYYNPSTRQSCCLSGCQPLCMDKYNIVPTEIYALMKARNIKGVIKIKGTGIVLETHGKKILFYITIMEYINDSITGDKFGACLRKAIANGKTHMAFGYIKKIMRKFHEINSALYNSNIYHNDLKNDNALVIYKPPRHKRANKQPLNCSVDLVEGGHVDLYLIDFGNAVTKNTYDQKFRITFENFVVSFLGNLAPELSQIQKGTLHEASIDKLLTWYFGAFIFELLNEKHIMTTAKQYGFLTSMAQNQQVQFRVVPQFQFQPQPQIKNYYPNVVYHNFGKRQSQFLSITNPQKELDNLVVKILEKIIHDKSIQSIVGSLMKQTLKIIPEERMQFQKTIKNNLFSENNKGKN